MAFEHWDYEKGVMRSVPDQYGALLVAVALFCVLFYLHKRAFGKGHLLRQLPKSLSLRVQAKYWALFIFAFICIVMLERWKGK